MPLRDTIENEKNEAKRSAYEVQNAVDSVYDRAASWLGSKIDVSDLISKLFQKLRR
jgi:hypothetical protein